jgi:sugar/nucleoside kinase (ribokinase family)
MQEFELGHPSRHAGVSSHPVEMVVVGHVGLATVRTPEDEQTSLGGSGYAVAASAAALIGRRVGLVAQVGSDLDLSPLRHLGVNLDGVSELPGSSARLRIEQLGDGTREFSADLGVAESVQVGSFPPAYLHAAYIHLGTAPPQQQLAWLQFLYERGCTAQISADMFEHYVTTSPDASRKVCDNANLVFMNQAECAGLYGRGCEYAGKAPLILKRGPDGASLIVDGLPQDVKAPPADVVDPTGGGEILAGVFLALCADGVPEIEALGYAARAAASCVEEFGVRGPRLVAALARIRLELGIRSTESPSPGRRAR